jgi:hypothetical protein
MSSARAGGLGVSSRSFSLNDRGGAFGGDVGEAASIIDSAQAEILELTADETTRLSDSVGIFDD